MPLGPDPKSQRENQAMSFPPWVLCPMCRPRGLPEHLCAWLPRAWRRSPCWDNRSSDGRATLPRVKNVTADRRVPINRCRRRPLRQCASDFLRAKLFLEPARHIDALSQQLASRPVLGEVICGPLGLTCSRLTQRPSQLRAVHCKSSRAARTVHYAAKARAVCGSHLCGRTRSTEYSRIIPA